MDITHALLMARAFTIIAAVPLGLMAVVNLFTTIRGGTLELSWPTYFLACAVIVAVYIAAALVGGTLVFALRPLRRWLLGWALTGAAVAAAVYGSCGLALAALFDPVGAAILENATRQQAWQMIPFLLLFVTPIGAVAGLVMGVKFRQSLAAFEDAA